MAGSPLRLKATAPTMPGFRESASAFITAAFGSKHSTASPVTMPSSGPSEARWQADHAEGRPAAGNVVDLKGALRRSVGGVAAPAKQGKPAKKPRKATAGQKEMLMSLEGKKPKEAAAAKNRSGSRPKREAGAISRRPGIIRSALQLIVYDLRLRSGSMDDYDPQREAEAAMKLAISTDGVDRQELIRLAMAWRELARARSGPERRVGRAA